MVYRDDINLASQALLILDDDEAFLGGYTDEQRLLELLTPMMVHFTRTQQAFNPGL